VREIDEKKEGKEKWITDDILGLYFQHIQTIKKIWMR